MRFVLLVVHKVLNSLLSPAMGGGELPGRVQVGAGLHLPHRLNGTVVHSDAVLGEDVSLYHQVTIGETKIVDGRPSVPRIGDRVIIYPGAKIVGLVHIGDDAVIGANAVVIGDVPAGRTVVAQPARLLSDG